MEQPQRQGSVPPPGAPTPPPIDTGVAGASARAEHDKRQANRRERNRKKYGKTLAGALEFLREPPQHEKAWAKGASGEERVADILAARCPGVIVLHDRQAPGSRANIDHIAIAPSGVWVIDPKKYKGKIQVKSPLFGAKKLEIAGRDRTKLVDGVKRQIEVVSDALRDTHPDITVRGALCFPGGDMSLFGLPDFDGIKLIWPKRLAKALNETGPLDGEAVDAIARLLAERLPAKA